MRESLEESRKRSEAIRKMMDAAKKTAPVRLPTQPEEPTVTVEAEVVSVSDADEESLEEAKVEALYQQEEEIVEPLLVVVEAEFGEIPTLTMDPPYTQERLQRQEEFEKKIQEEEKVEVIEVKPEVTEEREPTKTSKKHKKKTKKHFESYATKKDGIFED